MGEYQLYRRKGRPAEGIYRDFRTRVIEAEEAAEIRMVVLVMKAASEDPKHAQWWPPPCEVGGGRRAQEHIDCEGHIPRSLPCARRPSKRLFARDGL